MSAHAKAKPLITDVFVKGAFQGWEICTHSTIPNVLMAFVLIKILNLSGILTLIGNICGPIMGLFGLPGEAITILLGAWMSMGGGVGVAVALYDGGGITGPEMGAVIPAIYLMGSQIQYMGRCLGVIGIQGSDILKIMIIPPIVAILSLWVMKVIVFAV
ncbi:MAG: YjiG family protein [Burkholderiales bacterium]|nr:YjiG family protein [Burkholderiales bacterium]